MPPAASKREQILEYLKDTVLPLITAGADYTHTVRTIERGRRSPQALAENEFPAVFILGGQEKRKNLNQTQFESFLQVAIIGYVKNTKASLGADGTGTQKDLDKLIQDVTNAIEDDPLQNELVKWTEITDIATDEGDATPIGGFVMAVTFEYVDERSSP